MTPSHYWQQASAALAARLAGGGVVESYPGYDTFLARLSSKPHRYHHHQLLQPPHENGANIVAGGGSGCAGGVRIRWSFSCLAARSRRDNFNPPGSLRQLAHADSN